MVCYLNLLGGSKIVKEKEIELTPQEKEFAIKRLWKLSDEEAKKLIPNLSPFQKKFIKRLPDFGEYKIIQEVVYAKSCPLQAKKGDKIVYSGMGILLPEESSFGARRTGGYCTWMIMAMLGFVYACSDRLTDGIDDISPMGINMSKCMDMEPAEGGTGMVLFKVYAIKKRPTTKRYFSDK
jgi:uncharacterized repeat protein (TIGR04076 family)